MKQTLCDVCGQFMDSGPLQEYQITVRRQTINLNIALSSNIDLPDICNQCFATKLIEVAGTQRKPVEKKEVPDYGPLPHRVWRCKVCKVEYSAGKWVPVPCPAKCECGAAADSFEFVEKPSPSSNSEKTGPS